MKKIYLTACIVIAGVLQSQSAFSQCTPATPWIGYFPWTETATFPNAYTGFLCQGHDSIYTRPGWAYYDGDGYAFRLLAGSQVTVYIDSCATTNTCSITIVDSTVTAAGTGNVIAGAFSAAACPNSVSFTAPYSGTYWVVFDTDNDCSTFGSTAEGTASIKLTNASSFTNCNPFQPANDLICGAISLSLNTLLNGDNTNASVSDADDATLSALGYLCFTLNNTIWYTYTPSSSDSVDIFFGTDPLSNSLAGWFGVISTTAATTPCAGPFTYEGCYYGPLNATTFSGANATAPPFDGIIPTADSAINHLYLTGGTHYYFAIDGVAGDVGAFTFGIRTLATGVNDLQDNLASISVYPNPAIDGMINILNTNSDVKNIFVSVVNSIGQTVYSGKINHSGSTQVDLSFLSSGIYTIQLKSNDGVSNRKITIQNQN